MKEDHPNPIMTTTKKWSTNKILIALCGSFFFTLSLLFYYCKMFDKENEEMLEQRIINAQSYNNNTRTSSSPSPSIPYKCGVIYFYHIPSTGGQSINRWLLKYVNIFKSTKTNDFMTEYNNFEYLSYWCKHSDVREQIESFDNCSKEFVLKMNNFLSNFSKPNTWKMAQAHNYHYGWNQSAPKYLQRWRSLVESQGCQFISTIMFRDPLTHMLSKKSKNSSSVSEYLKDEHTLQLDFFLYNLDKKNLNVTKEEKVRRAMELLEQNFDYIFYQNHELFVDTMIEITGWPRHDMPFSNSHDGRKEFTKSHISQMIETLKRNGDIDFINSIKYKYDPFSTLFIV